MHLYNNLHNIYLLFACSRFSVLLQTEDSYFSSILENSQPCFSSIPSKNSPRIVFDHLITSSGSLKPPSSFPSLYSSVLDYGLFCRSYVPANKFSLQAMLRLLLHLARAILTSMTYLKNSLKFQGVVFKISPFFTKYFTLSL